MRTIKFRVWDIHDKMMRYENDADAGVEGYPVLLAIGFHGLPISVSPDSFKEKKIFGWNRDHNLYLMQYTGLTDRNGKEIYEGDILTSPQYPFQDDGEFNYHAVVDWGDEYPAFFLIKRLVNRSKRGISDGISEPMMEYDLTDFEVIGNIYENPDLLPKAIGTTASPSEAAAEKE